MRSFTAVVLFMVLSVSVFPVQFIHEVVDRHHIVVDHHHEGHEHSPCITTDYEDCPCIQLDGISIYLSDATAIHFCAPVGYLVNNQFFTEKIFSSPYLPTSPRGPPTTV